ncbi:2-oxoacid dehydrogenases acyltransferase family protein [Wolffia australiana]
MKWQHIFRRDVATVKRAFVRNRSSESSHLHRNSHLGRSLNSLNTSNFPFVEGLVVTDRGGERSRIFRSCMFDILHSFKTSRHFSAHGWVDPPAGAVVEVPLAQTGEGIAECEILKWFVHEGEDVDEFQSLCEIQSDKATMEITSRYKGKIQQILFSPGDTVKVGETLLKILVEENEADDKTLESLDAFDDLNSHEGELTNASLLNKESYRGVNSTPAVRHLAKHYGLDINDIKGTGKNGRILKEDVINFAIGRGALPESSKEEIINRGKNDDRMDFGDKVVHLTGFQRAMVKSMTNAVKIPHFHYLEEINFDALVKLKETFRDENNDPEIKHTYLPFLIKSLSLALGKHPLLNSSFLEESNEIILKGSINIGVAVATPHGLAVPNIKKVQSLSILEITRELMRLQKLAATNKLHADDIAGGTLTLSNIGSIGGSFGCPLINSPEVAIIALGRIRNLPRFGSDGSVSSAATANVVIGADHRVIDGAAVARFCNDWKALIERPLSLLLHLR